MLMAPSLCVLSVSWQSDHFSLRYSKYSIFDLQNSRSKAQQKSNQKICRPGQSIPSKMKQIWKVVCKLSCEQKWMAGDSGGRDSCKETGTKSSYPMVNRSDSKMDKNWNAIFKLLTLKWLGHFFQNVISFSDAVYLCAIFIWNWSNTMNV